MNAALKEKTLREQVKLPRSNQVCQLMLTLSYLWSPLQQALNQPRHPYPVLNAIDVINSDTCLGNVLKTRTNNGHQLLCLLSNLIIIILTVTLSHLELVNQLLLLLNVPVEHMLPSLSTRPLDPLSPHPLQTQRNRRQNDGIRRTSKRAEPPAFRCPPYVFHIFHPHHNSYSSYMINYTPPLLTQAPMSVSLT